MSERRPALSAAVTVHRTMSADAAVVTRGARLTVVQRSVTLKIPLRESP
jgi:hypothetical protein